MINNNHNALEEYSWQCSVVLNISHFYHHCINFNNITHYIILILYTVGE